MKSNYPSCSLFTGNCKIYSLSDKNRNIFYIGCTFQWIGIRLKGHMGDAVNNSGGNAMKNQRIQELNFDFFIREISNHNVAARSQAAAAEKMKVLETKVIVEHINRGFQLCNMRQTPGYVKAKHNTGFNSFNSVNLQRHSPN